ncbi:TIGR01906 family membrane protein [Micrococcus sp.]|uniref:TIGR01906 family membrane protein n=1 Tax=Micrococcus sp. TaxID=1271 RepID=UPI002A90A005|nr:TIGR01906 family membrane protein [Micrococcus sp.]MDY6055338.1 TIGR01906 family membrane protein [Micrococcus sp.]
MASHETGRAGSEDFESGLDYGAFVEDDDAEPTRSLDRTAVLGQAEEGPGDAGPHTHRDQHTSALSPEDLAALRGQDAGRAGGRRAEASGPEPVVATRRVEPASGSFTVPGAAASGPAASGPAAASGASALSASASASGGAVPAGFGAAAAGSHPADRCPGDGAAVVPDEVRLREASRLPVGAPRAAQVALAVLAPFVLLIAAVRLVATPLFLWLEYHRPGFPADGFGFSTADRMHYGSAGLDFLHNLAGPRYLSSLTHQGAPLFTAQEVAHMTDVKTVMLWTTAVGVLLTLVCVALAVYLHRTSPGGVRRALFAGAAWMLVALVVFAVLAALNWQGFFAGFHSLFFADGTWTFSPRDALIRLYPGQFWLDAALTVGLLCVLPALATLVAAWPSRRRRELARDRRTQLEATRLRWAREDAHTR